MSRFDADALAIHKACKGKISVVGKEIATPETLPLFYTPGVGAVSSHLAHYPEEANLYTLKGNTVAVISDGSAVLGLGNIGPAGAIPVMEGKAMLFKQMAGVDAFPIVLDTQNTDEIVDTIVRIAPVFGGINLEDISAPRCFEIERRLHEHLSIPIMHDDQHATAIVVLAGLINAWKVTKRNIREIKIVILGAGASATGTARLLVEYGIKNIVMLDSKGIVHSGRENLDTHKQELAALTNPESLQGSLQDALPGADCIIGLASANMVTQNDIRLMKKDPLVFVLSNPTPEIMPEEAQAAGAAVVATGRSDFPNQINNVLVFPGIFQGALKARVPAITSAMKLRAAANLAALVENPTADCIVPSVFDERVVPAVAIAVTEVR